jgi:hypothetical protein
MKEEKIQELLNSLFELQYDWEGTSGGKYKGNIIDKKYKLVIEQVLRNFLLENRDERLGVLEAKVFTYEQIISKSTFLPMLEKAN